MITSTKIQADAAVKSSAPAPFSDCSFREKICTKEKKFPGAAEEAAIILRQKGLDSAIISCESNGGTVSNLKASDRFIVDLNYMRKKNPEMYNKITTNHPAVHYACKDTPEVVVLRVTDMQVILKERN